MKTAFALGVVAALVLVAAGAHAEDAAAPKGFAAAAPSSPVPGPGSGDLAAMLANCDGALEACETDRVGVPYLAAAYIAIWGILLAFLMSARRGQQRLAAEVDELRERLRERTAEGTGSGK